MFESGVRKPSGTIILTDARGNTTQSDTKQCVHCNAHFQWVKGSGTHRGFCQLCMGVTCGAPKCMEHMAFEKKLELYEKGKLITL